MIERFQSNSKDVPVIRFVEVGPEAKAHTMAAKPRPVVPAERPAEASEAPIAPPRAKGRPRKTAKAA